MITFNIKGVPKSIKFYDFINEMKKFGFVEIKASSLKVDSSDKNVQSGQLVYKFLNNSDGLAEYCSANSIHLEKVKYQNLDLQASHSRESHESIPPRRDFESPAPRSSKTFEGNFGMAYYRESQGYGQKNILDSSLPKQEICRSFSHHFKLKTLYPGLLIGSGYLHPVMTESSKENVVDFQLGFFFDHSTGLPVIPGSSIKGVLRSVFSNPEMINEYLKEISSDLYLEAKDIEGLKDAIFEGKIDSKSMGMYERDIFHDAFLVAGDDENGEKFLADDYITPHIDELSDPKPIRFIKIRSNVTFQFNFDLKETKIRGKLITSETKKQLFLKILLDFGIGAKTNVGYGHLIGVDE